MDDTQLAQAPPSISIVWFAKVTNVNVEERLVTGVATAEVIDRQDDLIPLPVSKVAFTEFAAESGAVREMHQPKAIGKLTKWWADDSTKSIYVEVYLSKSTDGEDALTKVKEGILAGFSIGGRADEWVTEYNAGRPIRKITKCTIRELSLVDVPANPVAKVILWKSDGLPDSPTVSPMQAGDKDKIDKSPEPFHTVTLTAPESVPGSAVLAAAVNPGQAEVGGPAGQLIAAAVTPNQEPTQPASSGPAYTKAEDGHPIKPLLDAAKRAGIARHKDAPLTPPKGYPEDLAEYADPGNYAWPMDTPGRAKSALAYYNGGKGKDKYSPVEWGTLGRRIATMAAKKLDAKYKYNPKTKTVDRVEDTQKGDKPMKKGFEDLVTSARQVLADIREGDPAAASEAVDQLESIFDVMVDYAPPSQNEAGAAEASTAAATRQVSVENAGPEQTESTQKTASTTPTPTATTKTTEPPASTATDSSTPGKSTPAAMESDTVKNQTETGSDESSSSSSSESKTPEGLPIAQAAPAMPVEMAAAPAGNEPSKEIKKGDLNMDDKPFATTPPAAIGLGVDELTANLPAFIDALSGGSLKKAQTIAGVRFDEYFTKAQHAILDAGQWNYKNIDRLAASPKVAFMRDDDLNKAVNLADIPNIYLIRLAKLMLPVYAGLRRRLPQQTPPVGSNQATWRAQLGFSNLSFANAMSTAETSIGDAINETFLTFQAPFRRLSFNDKVSLEAVAGARGYDDPLQVAVIRALTAVLIGEERKLLGDNNAEIAKPASVTAVGSGVGTVGGATDKFQVSALTYRGWLAGSTGGAGAVGETDAAISAAVDIHLNLDVTISWPAVPGAVAYNVFYNPLGGANHYYVGTYTVNSVKLTTLPGAGNAPSATNKSSNANGYEGLIQWAEQSTIYTNAIPSKTVKDQAAKGLTTYAGGITEFDDVLASLWGNWQIAPSLIVTSPAGVRHLTKQILSADNPAVYRIEVQAERGTISGGAFVTGYVNKFAPYADGSPRVLDVMSHPYMPDGAYEFITESVPYPMARESRGFAIETLVPYTYFPLAQSDIAYPFAMVVSETLECFHPGAQAAIKCVDFNA